MRTIAIATVCASIIGVTVFTTTSSAKDEQQPVVRTKETVRKVVKKAQISAAERKLKRDTSELIVATWRCEENIPRPHSWARSPWKPHSMSFRRAQYNLWLLNHKTCKSILKFRQFSWNWQAFPSWVLSLARCESSYNWYAEGSSSDGVFYSAFNISRSQYDKDAHYMGVRGWYEGKGVPSPYEQAMAVVGHMRLLGDGFTGNCHGIAQSQWTSKDPDGVHRRVGRDIMLT